MIKRKINRLQVRKQRIINRLKNEWFWLLNRFKKKSSTNLKGASIIFENCASFYVEYPTLKYLKTPVIKTNISSYSNVITKNEVIDGFIIGLSKEVDTESKEKSLISTSIYDRLLIKDITQIELVFENKSKQTLYINWPSEKDRCCSDIQVFQSTTTGDILVYLECDELQNPYTVEDLNKFGAK